MKQELVDEILVDLVLEDVMNETSLVEGNAAHDAKGRFTSKGAGAGDSAAITAAYKSGAMAAGRAAGIRAKAIGHGREEIRKMIQTAMREHSKSDLGGQAFNRISGRNKLHGARMLKRK